MQSEDMLGDGMVKVGSELITIPAGQTKTVKCFVRAGILTDTQDVLFEPSQCTQLPEGLQTQSGVVQLQKGIWSMFKIPVSNTTTCDIQLSAKTVLGQTQRVKTIYPADIRPTTVSQVVTHQVRNETENTKMDCAANDSMDIWDPPVPLDHLPPTQ